MLQTIYREVFSTGTGTKRVSLMVHALLATIVEKARSKDTVLPLYRLFESLLSRYLVSGMQFPACFLRKLLNNLVVAFGSLVVVFCGCLRDWVHYRLDFGIVSSSLMLH